MRTRTWPVVVVVVLSSFSLTHAQEDDCAKCDVKVGPFNNFHINQAVCPGANAIVCDNQFDNEYSSSCVVGTQDLRDCKTVINRKNYPTKNHPPNTCGTAKKDAQGNVIGAACGLLGAGAPAGAAFNWTAHGCTGLPWLDAMAPQRPMDGRYAVMITTPHGLTSMTPGAAVTLGSTRLSLPAAVFKAAQDQFRLDGKDLVFTLSLRPLGSDAFSIPAQTFAAAAQPGLTLAAPRIKDGLLEIDARIVKGHIGAYGAFELDLRGLRIQAGAGDVGLGAESADQGLPEDARLGWLAVDVVGTKGPVIGGVGTVAHLESPAVAPPPPTSPTTSPPAVAPPAAKSSRMWLYAAVGLGLMLALSWLHFMRNRRT